ncbi:phage portal protein [Tumebacillus permanentifrigoris]|uniref:HK97 family phage portal protein n=1 Tax=Tumebacillus permanentifrigoris TaxID=378543 RepID=A0A316D7E6_9BACL|nr:phage portal protein [Tumebacillus permanentifrigoris]PWK05309.1 HK97 family phage portal protein [Tumebacillus permanentifrigoris]
MGLAQRVISFFRRSEKRSSFGSFSKWFDPVNIFSKLNNGTLANNETIFAAVNRLSNSLASLPLKVYKDYQPIGTKIADMMANGPNSYMTSFVFIRTMEAFRNTSGNSYAIKEFDDRYQVVGLHILDPAKVEPVIERDSKELYYKIQGDDGTYYVHNLDIVHVSYVHTTGFKGISPLDVLRNSIEYDAKVKDFSLTQMESGLKASFILKSSSMLDPAKAELKRKQFQDFYAKGGKSVIVLEGGDMLDELKQNLIDTKVFEVEKITRTRVATVYNMSPHMLNDGQESFSSMEQKTLEYVQFTLAPNVRMYEQEFNKKLLTPEERASGAAFKFNLNGILRGDIKTRGDFYFKGVRSGWFTPNEIRAYEELPPLAGGEKLYMSRDLSPIDSPDREGLGKGVKQKNGAKTDPAA